MAAIRFNESLTAFTSSSSRDLAADRPALAGLGRKGLEHLGLHLDRMLQTRREQIFQMRDRGFQPRRGIIVAEHDTGLDQIEPVLHDFELRQMQVAVEHPAIGRVENASGGHLAAVAD